jgi:hypothetical protein
VFRGGDKATQFSRPMIVRGEPEQSLLYLVLTPNPPVPFIRMPQGGSLAPEDIDLVRAWILDGARSAPPGPPDIGVDLATVSYKNMVAMHLDPSGALYARHDGDQGGAVRFVDVAATGATLQALAAMGHLATELPDLQQNLQAIAGFAVARLTDDEGAVVEEFDVAADTARGTADLFIQARMTAGLLAAGRALGSPAISGRGERLAQRLLAAFLRRSDGLFRSDLGTTGITYTPRVLAALLDALREMAAAGVPDGVAVLQRLIGRLSPVLVYSEVASTGEVVGDGIADTDRDGVVEPAFAGGAFGRAPLLVGEIKEGLESPPLLDGPILWSEHIQPLLRSVCAQCHLDGANQGEYRIDTPSLLRVKGAENPGMPLVVPGDPEASYLYRKLVDRRPPGGEQMPLQTPPLDDRGKELMRRWIAEGATSR